MRLKLAYRRIRCASAGLLGAFVAALAVSACAYGGHPSAAAPTIVVTPQTVLFEPTGPGRSDSQVLLVENVGDADLVIYDIEVDGPDGVFAIEAGYEGGSITVEPDGSVELVLSYTPTEAGRDYVGALALSHDGKGVPGGVTRVPLQVRQSAPRLFVSPNPIDFGRVPAGEHSEITVALTNIGGDMLSVTDFFVVGGAGEFTIPAEYVATAQNPVVLAPDERFEAVIAYDPSDDAPGSAVLIVKTSEDGAHEVQVVANPPVPCIRVSPDDGGAFDFGERFVGRTWEQAFTILNCSHPSVVEPLIVTEIGLNGSSSAAFALAGLPELPLELGPGDELEFVVAFVPELDLQAEAGTLTIASNDPYAPQVEVGLLGSGTSNECPVAHAVCTVDGSGEPANSDLFILPLANLSCSGAGSSDVDGDIVEFIWSVHDRPEDSTSVPRPEDAAETSFFVDLSGRYVLALEVVDDRANGRSGPKPRASGQRLTREPSSTAPRRARVWRRGWGRRKGPNPSLGGRRVAVR